MNSEVNYFSELNAHRRLFGTKKTKVKNLISDKTPWTFFRKTRYQTAHRYSLIVSTEIGPKTRKTILHIFSQLKLPPHLINRATQFSIDNRLGQHSYTRMGNDPHRGRFSGWNSKIVGHF